MREGWSYKKLGEVCEIARGGSPRPITEFITNNADGVNWIKIGDAIEGDKYIRSTKEKIIKEGIKKSRFVHKGDFILSNSMSFGRPYILAIDGCIHDGWLVLHDEQGVFIKDFLYYLLSSPTMYAQFEKLAVGGVVNNLNSKLVSNVSVVIPPKSQQEAIVAELDEINSLLALKREQLQKYDNLAQSLFYEMFGDPVENEKGWEVKKLGELCPVSSFKRVLVEDVLENGPVPFIRGTELSAMCKEGKSDFKMFITMEHYEKVKSISGVPKVGDLLIPSINSEGLVWVVNTLEPMYYKDGRVLWVHIDSDEISSIALQKILNNLLRDNYSKITNGAVFAELNLSVLRSFPVILPPLSLQQQFAFRIEQIESQKQQVQAAIEKLETLLASRMQYWFD